MHRRNAIAQALPTLVLPPPLTSEPWVERERAFRRQQRLFGALRSKPHRRPRKFQFRRYPALGARCGTLRVTNTAGILKIKCQCREFYVQRNRPFSTRKVVTAASASTLADHADPTAPRVNRAPQSHIGLHRRNARVPVTPITSAGPPERINQYQGASEAGAAPVADCIASCPLSCDEEGTRADTERRPVLFAQDNWSS